MTITQLTLDSWSQFAPCPSHAPPSHHHSRIIFLLSNRKKNKGPRFFSCIYFVVLGHIFSPHFRLWSFADSCLVLWTVRSLHPRFTGEVSSKCIHREFFSLFILDPFLLSNIKYMKIYIYIYIYIFKWHVSSWTVFFVLFSSKSVPCVGGGDP